MLRRRGRCCEGDEDKIIKRVWDLKEIGGVERK
jgi:hypothetical protein